MAKVTCNIVKDLLPLYVDGVISEDSGKLVEEHIESCSECKDYYNQLKDADIPVEKAADDKAAIKKIRRRLNLKKIIVGCIVAAVVAAGSFGAYYKCVLDENYMTYEESGLYVKDNALMTNERYYSFQSYDSADNKAAFIYMTTTFYESHKGEKTTVKAASVMDLNEYGRSIVHDDKGNVAVSDQITEVYYVPESEVGKLNKGYWSESETENKEKTNHLKSISELVWKAE